MLVRGRRDKSRKDAYAGEISKETLTVRKVLPDISVSVLAQALVVKAVANK